MQKQMHPRPHALLTTAPFFIALGARAFLHEALRIEQWSGLALAFIGIVLAIGVPDPTVDTRTLAGDALMIAAAATWAATTLVIKGTVLATISAEKTTVYQLAVSAVILGACIALFGEETGALPGPVALGSNEPELRRTERSEPMRHPASKRRPAHTRPPPHDSLGR